jgi:hypothetical protein
MKLVLLFVFLFNSFVPSFGQNNNVTKKQLVEVINLTINQRINFNTKQSENGFYAVWYTNNNDNVYSTIDTLRLYNSKNIMDDGVYHCEFKILEFSKLNKFSDKSFNNCADPRMTQAESEARNRVGMDKVSMEKLQKLYDRYIPKQYKIIEKGGDVLLVLFTGKKVFRIFKLEDIRNYNAEKLGKDSYVITLVRQK